MLCKYLVSIYYYYKIRVLGLGDLSGETFMLLKRDFCRLDALTDIVRAMKAIV